MARTANPQYIAKWQKEFDAHKEKHDALSAKMNLLRRELAENTDINDFASLQSKKSKLEQLSKELQEHSNEMQLHLSNYQHRTIQDIAKWHLGQISGIDLLQFKDSDLDQLTTVGDALRLYNTAEEYSQQADKNTFTPEKSNPKDVFSAQRQSHITYRQEFFDVKELIMLKKQWWPHDTDTPYTIDRALQTPFAVHTIIDKQDGQYHICFFEDDSNADHTELGISVKNHITQMAYIMYKRLCAEDGIDLMTDQTNVRGVIYLALKRAFHMTTHAPACHAYRYAQPDPILRKSFMHAPDPFQNGPGSMPMWDIKHPSEIVENRYKELYPEPTSGAALIKSVIGKKRKIHQAYHNVPLEAQYLQIANAWNNTEHSYRNDILNSFNDYIELQKRSIPNFQQNGQMYSVMRNIVSEFENYALDTAEAFLYARGLSSANPKIQKLFTDKFKETESYRKSARHAVRTFFKRSNGQGMTRVGKILSVFKAIGYPVDRFKELEDQYQTDWKDAINSNSQTANRILQYQFDAFNLINFSKNIDNIEELIKTRNAIEHEKKYVEINEVDLARYINSVLVMMNNLKHAFDLDISNNTETEFDAANHSYINFSSTMNSNTFIKAVQHVQRHQTEELLGLLESWIAEGVNGTNLTNRPTTVHSKLEDQSRPSHS